MNFSGRSKLIRVGGADKSPFAALNLNASPPTLTLLKDRSPALWEEKHIKDRPEHLCNGSSHISLFFFCCNHSWSLLQFEVWHVPPLGLLPVPGAGQLLLLCSRPETPPTVKVDWGRGFERNLPAGFNCTEEQCSSLNSALGTFPWAVTDHDAAVTVQEQFVWGSLWTAFLL